MNRKLIITLLRKDIQELDMITEGFMEMTEYPKAILNLVQKKSDDIQSYIKQLSELNNNTKEEVYSNNDTETTNTNNSEPIKPVEVIDGINPIEDSELIETIEPIETSEIVEPVELIEPTELKPQITQFEIIEKPAIEEEEEEEEEEEQLVEEIAEEINQNDSIQITEQVIEYTEIEEETEISTITEIESEEEVKNFITETINKTEVHEIISITNTETKSIIEDTKRTILADKLNSNSISRNDSLHRADNSISNSLANKKITDIKQAINIGDRFRFQRELFRGNGEDMNKTLTYINQLATLAEVQSFLQSKYNWNHENEAVEDFYQIVRRRFL